MTASASPSCRMRTGRAVCPTGTCPALHSRVVPQGPGLSQPPSPGRTLRRLPGTRASGGPWGGAEAPAVPTVVGAAAEETEPSRADSALVRWRRLALRHRRAGAQESGARHHKVLRAHELHESVVGRASSAPGTRARATGGGTSDRRRHERPAAARATSGGTETGPAPRASLRAARVGGSVRRAVPRNPPGARERSCPAGRWLGAESRRAGPALPRATCGAEAPGLQLETHRATRRAARTRPGSGTHRSHRPSPRSRRHRLGNGAAPRHGTRRSRPRPAPGSSSRPRRDRPAPASAAAAAGGPGWSPR